MKSIITPELIPAEEFSSPCLRNLLPEEIELARNSRTQIVFQRGENLVKQGFFGSGILLILDGVAKLSLDMPGGRHVNLQMAVPGDYVGLSVAFGKDKYPYTATALNQVTCCLIEKEMVIQLARSNGVYAHELISKHCQTNYVLFDTITKLTGKQMNGRIAETLLYIAEVQPDIFTLLSRKDIADFAGVSTESTVKILKGLEADGLIKLQNKDIQIVNRPALEEISRKG